jgi:hypothetical protein
MSIKSKAILEEDQIQHQKIEIQIKHNFSYPEVSLLIFDHHRDTREQDPPGITESIKYYITKCYFLGMR